MHLYIITPQRRSQSTFSKRPSPKLTHLLPPSSDQVQRRQHGYSRSSGVRGRQSLPSPQRSSPQRLAHRCRHHGRSLAQEQGHLSRSQHSDGITVPPSSPSGWATRSTWPSSGTWPAGPARSSSTRSPTSRLWTASGASWSSRRVKVRIRD